jgi:two-component system probable response regulator PhcQ
MEQSANNQDHRAPKILFVDDEATAVKYFERAINALAPIITANSVEAGKRMLDMHADTLLVLVSDQRMPGGYGNELLQYAQTQYPHIIRILTTAYSELEQTVEAINRGQIHRYIHKPWEISAIRMELKQAMELANLRKERNQLLREKLGIWQKQIMANRIATLSLLFTNLAGNEPLETYLSAVNHGGMVLAEPDWNVVHYADIISAEAARSSQFGVALRNRLEQLRQRYPHTEAEVKLEALTMELDGYVNRMANEPVVIIDADIFSGFLRSATNEAIPESHVTWAAWLLWVNEGGESVKLEKKGTITACRLQNTTLLFTQERLAVWIEQFCD